MFEAVESTATEDVKNEANQYLSRIRDIGERKSYKRRKN
jgi:hypothetical protein